LARRAIVRLAKRQGVIVIAASSAGVAAALIQLGILL
jgi:hypothetical protein